MAVNVNQPRFLQPIRSVVGFSSYSAAMEHVNGLKEEFSGNPKSDGVSVVARYNAGTNDSQNWKFLNAIYSKTDNKFTFFVHDSEDIEALQAKDASLDEDIKTLQEKDNNLENKIADAEAAAKAAATLINEKSEGFVKVSGEQNSDTGAWTYTISESDIASASALTQEISDRQQGDNTLSNNLNSEISDRKAQDNKIEASIGLSEDGSHITTNGNYTSSATSVVGEIVALDSQVKENADAIELLQSAVGEGGSVSSQITSAIEELDVVDNVVDNKYVSSVSETDGKISVARRDLVSSSDTVLSFTENGITSTIEIKKLTSDEISALADENVAEAYKLVGKDSTQLGETIKIYKDQTLKDVNLDKQELVFTYILSNGSEKVVRVDVSKFLTESEYGNGLQVINNVISAKLGEDTESNKNFLDLEGETEGEKSLVVRSIDTDSTLLQKDLKVAGLSGQFGAGYYKNNDVIPAGTDLYTILQNILCQELYPTNVSSSSASATASMSSLKLTLDKTGTQEVGTLVTLTVGKTDGSSVSKTDSKLVNMEYGYSAADDDSVDSTNTSIVKTTTTAISDNNYTVSATIDSGFNADTVTNVKTTPTTSTGVGSAALSETALGCVVEGKNTITINATGASYSYITDAIDMVYYCSNLGNTDSEKYHTGVSAVNSVTSKPTKSASATVTGNYKYFLGYSDNTSYDQFDSASVRALTIKSSWVTIDGTTTIVSSSSSITSNGKSIVIACPSKYKLATIANGVGADILANFSSVGEVDVTTGSIVTKYKVYVYPITNGASVEFKNVTLTKA